MHIGKNIKKAMIDHDRSQSWLANELGVSRQRVYRMCSKEHLNTATVERVANCLGIPVTDLVK